MVKAFHIFSISNKTPRRSLKVKPDSCGSCGSANECSNVPSGIHFLSVSLSESSDSIDSLEASSSQSSEAISKSLH